MWGKKITRKPADHERNAVCLIFEKSETVLIHPDGVKSLSVPVNDVFNPSDIYTYNKHVRSFVLQMSTERRTHRRTAR